jgi:phenylacetate-CoA ligase
LEFLRCGSSGLIDKVHQEFVYGTTMQYRPGDVIVAFDGSSVPANLRDTHVYWVARSDDDVPYGRLSYSSLYLTDETLPYYVSHLLSIAPSILRGYPSMINDVAAHILEKNISIPFRVKGVQLTAENVHDWQIENIRNAFNTSVYLQYGHSEVCVYGYTSDETYEYRCSPFYGYTEVLGTDGNHVNVGEVGEVIATGFYTSAMPLVRYRTGDLAVFGGDENGIVRLKKMAGRTQDFILTKDGAEVALTALVFGQHYRAFGNIQKWQLQQSVPGEVTVRIVKGQGFSTEDEIEIRTKFMDICGVHTQFEYVDAIPLSPRGKYRFLIRSTQP